MQWVKTWIRNCMLRRRRGIVEDRSEYVVEDAKKTIYKVSKCVRGIEGEGKQE